ncbi:MAG: hypothetical protein HC883_01895, partial [Bdellovibrionaceae bacterium]|nr:hypothetical protein [Pseudobdellovibrionaceae bacterium]
MDPLEQFLRKLTGNSSVLTTIIGIFVLVVLLVGSTYVIPPGHRGVLVTMGKVSSVFAPEGLGFKMPFRDHGRSDFSTSEDDGFEYRVL